MKNRIKKLLKLMEERKSVLYPHEAVTFRNYLENLGDRFNASNSKHMVRFLEVAFSKGLTIQRMNFYLERLAVVQSVVRKDFKKYTRRDMEKLMLGLGRLKNNKGGDRYSPRTIQDFKEIVRTFWRWLYDVDEDEKAPKCVKWLKVRRIPNSIEAKDLVTPEEYEKLLAATKNLMNKCAISLLYHTGMRPGEMRGIKFDDFSENGDNVKFTVRGKMRKSQGVRTVFLVDKKAIALLKGWVSTHPTGKGYLFTKIGGVPIAQNDLKKLINRTADKAGLKKRCYAYLFRHTFGTWAYKTHGVLIGSKMMGHSERSRMCETYCHLGEEDVLNALLGKKPSEPEPQDAELIAKKTGEEKEFLGFLSWLSGEVDLRSKFKEWKKQQQGDNSE